MNINILNFTTKQVLNITVPPKFLRGVFTEVSIGLKPKVEPPARYLPKILKSTDLQNATSEDALEGMIEGRRP